MWVTRKNRGPFASPDSIKLIPDQYFRKSTFIQGNLGEYFPFIQGNAFFGFLVKFLSKNLKPPKKTRPYYYFHYSYHPISSKEKRLSQKSNCLSYCPDNYRDCRYIGNQFDSLR